MSKQKRSQAGKKKLIRNILICAAIVVVVAAIIFLSIALQTDGAGYNLFQRKATVASADGVKVSMIEYRMTFDNEAQNNIYVQYYSMLGMTVEDVQEYVARIALLRKIYIKESKALGLTLTKEEQEACKQEAQEAVDSVENYYKESMVQNGTYSKTALEKQLADVYRQFGMNQNEYYAYALEIAQAGRYQEKLQAYYLGNEEAVAKYYQEIADKQKESYEEGMFWEQLNAFLSGNSSVMPILHVPEGFIYTDFIEIEAADMIELKETIRKVTEGETSFDELMDSDSNVYAYHKTFKGPYPISEFDHKGLFAENDAYKVVEGLAVGEIGSFIVPSEKTESGEETETKVKAYLFRRANGTMCVEGESGLIRLDAIPGLSDSINSGYLETVQQQWLSDVKFEKALYTYKGALE